MAKALSTAIYVYMLLAASLVALSPTSVLIIDRPVHLAVLTLIVTSILLLIVSYILPTRAAACAHQQGQWESIPLQELQNDGLMLEQCQKKGHDSELSGPLFVMVVLGATIALTLRIEILRRTILAPECASSSKAIWLPLLIAIHDVVRARCSGYREVKEMNLNSPSASPSSVVAWSFSRMLPSSSLRYVPAALLLSTGCYSMTDLESAARSTLICPLAGWDALLVPGFQWLCLFLDVGLTISAQRLGRKCRHQALSFLPMPMPWMIVTTLSAGVWMVAFVLVYDLQPENQAWLLMSLESRRYANLAHLFRCAVFVSSLCITTLYNIVNRGLVDVSMTMTAIFVIITRLRFFAPAAGTYPAVPPLSATLPSLAVFGSLLLCSRTKRKLLHSSDASSGLMQTIAFVTLAMSLLASILKNYTIHDHPIDLLMRNARRDHVTYIQYASQSKDLISAVRVYQERYGDNPPPGFDIWFEFAQNRSVWVVDDFDQIHRDLLPFRALSPAQLRARTGLMASDTHSGVKAIRIRKGKAYIQDDVVPTHRWMLEGVVHILDNFSHNLPDIDIGFNLADECRVAVPYAKLKQLREKGSREYFRGTSTFTFDRVHDWKNTSEAPSGNTIFEDWSLSNTYREWAASSCPPNSAARTRRMPLYKSWLCLDCIAKHDIDQFLSNWTVAADPCHQPDLATAHGFFLSPAVFNATHELYPIFSQSKIGGFNDIIYPSAWNYMDKVMYAPTESTAADQPAFPDPPFREKESILFWRGGTSEGISDGHGAWRGMVRQRMVHLANNLTTSQFDSIDLLLPDQNVPQRFTHAAVPASSLQSLGLHTDVHFVKEIIRCGGRDCDEQANEFELVGPVDFQSHWKYKYLVDLDGAGFSGRFLPFLQSRSLPFKSALFREWYDSRLTAWVHFVPLDLRLHGVWSTLAYFSGVSGVDGRGLKWDWAGHEDAAESIAEAGREWSSKVLTKHDMEVYLFRLLLEWARLTDDRRSELGFSLD